MKIVVDASVAVKWVVDEIDADLALGLFDTVPQANEAIGKIESYFDGLVPTRPLVPRALSIATEIDHPIYDCIYLALAGQLDAAFVTGDRRLRSKALGLPSIRIHPLTDGAPAPH